MSLLAEYSWSEESQREMGPCKLYAVILLLQFHPTIGNRLVNIM